MIKVIIVDDQVILRESLKFIIEQDNDIEIVGCTGNGKDALDMCDELLPDIVLMDLIMPVCDGVKGTKLIKAKHSQIKVIILTTYSDDENVSRALKNGADGYILKDIKPTDLVTAIKSTVKGLGVIHQNAFSSIVRQFNISSKPGNVREPSQYIDLTDRELSVIQLIVDGKGNKEIALDLYLTEGSIKNIVSGILSKLKLKDRTQLAVFAVKNNLV